MSIYDILELALGTIRPDVVVAQESLREAMEYAEYTRDLAAIVDVLNVAVELGELIRYRHIQSPTGLNVGQIINVVSTLSGGTMLRLNECELISLNDWLRIDSVSVDLSRALRELRKVLITHCINDNVHPAIDLHLYTLYITLIKRLIVASE